MSKNRYYHYDHESCSFVEVKPKRTKLYAQAALAVVTVLVLSGAFALGIDRLSKSPEELALQEENTALQEQLQRVDERMQSFSGELSKLSEADQNLYRALLQADPISEDVRQVGTGGTDRYERFSRYSTSSAELLRETSQKLDQLERQISLQNMSYRELAEMARENEIWLTQMPAILPTDGPIVSGYGMRHHPILRVDRMHKGLDIVVSTGTPVFASGDGVIEKAGRGSGYGKHIIIDHAAAGYKTFYAHLSAIPDHIKPGRKVERGEQIGLSGNTGLSKAPHLHYEVRDREGRALNPVQFIAPSLTPQEYRELLEAAENSKISLD